MPGKVKYHNLTSEQKKKYLGEFYSMVALLGSRNEVKNFFKDLLTLSEVVMISRRIQIAKMLLEEHSYEKIKKELKVGGTTISQVEKWLHGGFGGYKKAIRTYKNKYKKTSNLSATPFSYEWVRKKYPIHYLLSNLINKD
jgi:TrpR-related protein YerC/YecD